jgi:alkane 1-monooxygenase
MRPTAYLLSLAFPLLAASSLLLEGWWTLLTPALIYGLVPLLEMGLGAPTAPPPGTIESARMEPRWMRGLLWLHGVLHLTLLAWGAAHAGGGSWSGLEWIGRTLSLGTEVGAVMFVVAHELGHRPRPADRRLARLLLASAFYPQFGLEHDRGHHRFVGTPADPVTARRGEGLWAFLARAIPGCAADGFRTGRTQAQRRGRATLGPGNPFLMDLLAALVLLAAVAGLLGPLAAGAWLAASLFGVFLLESVEYIQHYGLERRQLEDGSFERVAARHSWNSNHPIGRALLIELPRHADHHAHAARPYGGLRSLEGAPQLLLGYPGSILMATVPPLWRRVMDPRIPA